MVTRAAYMIESGISADQILMFTFTRKAANEMKERVAKKIGTKAKGMMVSTYHSFCCTILRSHAQVVGINPNFTIYDEEDSLNALGKVIDSLRKKNDKFEGIKAKDVKQEISRYKDQGIFGDIAVKNAEESDNGKTKKFARIYKEYETYLRKNNAVDFDDLPFFAIKILEKDANIRHAYNEKYRFIIIDEMQDSSPADSHLISLLAGDNVDDWNVMCVGDIDQSIFSFRGSDINYVMKFIKDNNFTVHNMGQNYRSTKTIVEASDSLIRRNKVRIKKEVFTENRLGDKIAYIVTQDEKEEAKQVIRIIKSCVKAGMSYSDIAVLYRMNSQSRLVEQTLALANIPCKVLGNGSFFSRKVIRDMIAYARLTVNSNDREAMSRIINIPKRGVGPASLNAIMSYVDEHEGVNLFEACNQVKLRNRESKKGVNAFMAIMEQLMDVVTLIHENGDGQRNVGELFTEIYNITGYEDYLAENSDKETFEQDKSDIEELIKLASDYTNVNDFLNSVTDYIDKQEDESSDAVNLLTMHGSKGLEWPAVIVIGCNQGKSPSGWAIEEGNLEEERRLFFVAMTRAKRNLFLLRAKNVRTKDGGMMFARESQFIKEIDNEYIRRL